MLDLTYNDFANIEGNYIRMGIEFNAQGKRVAYHFWRYHPNDERPMAAKAYLANERVRIPAQDILHIKERRQAGQLRGTPKVASAMTKLFQLDSYNEAELDRKKTAAMFTYFLVGNTDNAALQLDENSNTPIDDEPLPDLEPGAGYDLGPDKDIRFSNPAEVGGSYEPFQYRMQLMICAALNIPYAVATGDVTRGNFSNVRTAVIQFRRHVKQWRSNVLVAQLNNKVWARFVTLAQMSNAIKLPNYDQDPDQWLESASFAAPLEAVDPEKEIAAENAEMAAGLLTRTMALQRRGLDRDKIDAQLKEEQQAAQKMGLNFSFNAPSSTPQSNEPQNSADDQLEQDQSAKSSQSNAPLNTNKRGQNA